jgi:hypothetical protein
MVGRVIVGAYGDWASEAGQPGGPHGWAVACPKRVVRVGGAVATTNRWTGGGSGRWARHRRGWIGLKRCTVGWWRWHTGGWEAPLLRAVWPGIRDGERGSASSVVVDFGKNPRLTGFAQRVGSGLQIGWWVQPVKKEMVFIFLKFDFQSTQNRKEI